MSGVLLVLVPLLLVQDRGDVRRGLGGALSSVRGVLYALAILVVLVSVGTGAGQVDDVIRAWDLPDAMFAVGGSLALAVTVAGVVRHLSGNASEHHSPHARRSAQPPLMGSGVVLIGVGLLLWMAGMGWGLRSPEGCSSARG